MVAVLSDSHYLISLTGTTDVSTKIGGIVLVQPGQQSDFPVFLCPSLDPHLVRFFIVKRSDGFDTAPSSFSGSDAEPILEWRGRQKIIH